MAGGGGQAAVRGHEGASWAMKLFLVLIVVAATHL